MAKKRKSKRPVNYGHSTNRDNVRRRLLRRGLINKGDRYSTDYLNLMWKTHVMMEERRSQRERNVSVITPKSTNYEILERILANTVREYKQVFIGWVRDAWRWLPELERWMDNVDKDKVNNDPNFTPSHINILFVPLSDWEVDGYNDIQPEFVVDWFNTKFAKYLKDGVHKNPVEWWEPFKRRGIMPEGGWPE